ncbi:MAG: Nramp family divalent metal transporter [Bacteroidales bacterium]
MITLIKKILNALGPGVIIAAVVLGPGSITVSSQIGAAYGYKFLWGLVFACVFMITYTSMSARYGATNEKSVLQTISLKYGKWFSLIIGTSAFLSSMSFQFGNNIGIGIGMGGITGIDERIWPLIFTPLALWLIFGAKNLYRILEKLMMGLVLIMIISFIVNLIMTKPEIVPLVKGFIPTAVEKQQLGILAALLGTSFSLAGALYHSYLAQDKGWKVANLKSSLRDTYTGIIMLTTITAVIIITSAASLHPAGIKVSSAADMAFQLESLYGSYAKVIFSIGLCAAAFSSLMVNAIIGGGLMSDGLGLGRSMNDRVPRIFTAIILVTGMMVALFLRGNVIYALIMAQASSILAVPLIGLGLLLVANNKEIMGAYRNNWLQNIFALAGLLSVSLMVYFMYRSLINYLGIIT